MLRGNALNNTEPMIRVLEERDARAQDLIRMNKNKVVIGRSIELERVMKEKERAEREFFQFYSKAQAREMEKAVEEHVRVISTKKNQVKPALKAMSANEEEMTIIMVQDGEEIRITVKDSR
jgi:ketopantoate reductase